MSLIVMVGYGLLGLIVVAAAVLAMVGIAALHARFTRESSPARRITAPIA